MAGGPLWDTATLKKCGSFLKVKHKLIIPSNYTPKDTSTKSENVCPHKDLDVNVHRRIIPNGPTLETIPKFTNWEMGKQNVEYQHHGILLSS